MPKGLPYEESTRCAGRQTIGSQVRLFTRKYDCFYVIALGFHHTLKRSNGLVHGKHLYPVSASGLSFPKKPYGAFIINLQGTIGTDDGQFRKNYVIGV